MSESVDEDIYKLEQMKSLASDMYNQRKHEKPGGNDVDRYAHHIGETIHHLCDAIRERAAEKPNKESSASYAGNSPIQAYTEIDVGKLEIIVEKDAPRWEGIFGLLHCGESEISVDQADIYEAWERASLSYDALERLRECE